VLGVLFRTEQQLYSLWYNKRMISEPSTFSPLKCNFDLNVHGSVPRNNVLIYIQQDATLHGFFYREIALHVSGGTQPNIRSAYNCIYSIWYLSHRYCYLPLSWKSWNWFECAVGGLSHPQHSTAQHSNQFQPFHDSGR